MSDRLTYFERGIVRLPFDASELIADWSALQATMIRQIPDEFSRDEWAYLISFLGEPSLWEVFTSTFGAQCEPTECGADRLFYPRGTAAVWLPNNVSLLGPLLLILLSLTGNRCRLKGGSRGVDLCGPFLRYVSSATRGRALKAYLQDRVTYERFDQNDPRNAEMASESEVRLVFGGDAATRDIDALPHPVHSLSFSFTDRRSEAWLEPAAVNHDVLKSLVKVFLIYGQAGCTSPSRVVLLDADAATLAEFRAQLLDVWAGLALRPPEPHIASANFMARQWAASAGWDAVSAPGMSAVIGLGPLDLMPVDAPLFLPLSRGTLRSATERLPRNVQTIGHAVRQPRSARWLERLVAAGVKRFVPIERMHHFGPVWDGHLFWQQQFECMEMHD